MHTRKAYKYRVFPTKPQQKQLEASLDICRELYNASLQERRDAYRAWEKANKGFAFTQIGGVLVIQLDVNRPAAPKLPQINYYTQANQLAEIKAIRPELNTVHSQVLQDVLKRVDKAFKGFFARVKRGETPGYPRFQGKNRYNSFTFPQGGWSIKNNKLTLSKLGTFKLKLHREAIGKVKTCTIKREGECWYVVFSVEYEFEQPTSHPGPAVGIDVGLKYFASLSNGEQFENPRYYRKAQKNLAKVQRRYAKVKHLHWKNPKRRKAIRAITKAHRKVRNQRLDFTHKLSHSLTETYSVIVIEDLQVKNLSKRPKPKENENNPGHYLPNGASAKSGLNKSISDAGWSTFVTMLAYKVEYTGSKLIKVSPAYSSQVCPECGSVQKKELSQRWHSCECGCELPRDVAAAKVLLSQGLLTLGNQSLEARRFSGSGVVTENCCARSQNQPD